MGIHAQDPGILKWKLRVLTGGRGFPLGRSVIRSTAYRKADLEKEITVKTGGKLQCSTRVTWGELGGLQ